LAVLCINTLNEEVKMRFKKILVPIDFSHFSKKALGVAVKLAECCGGKIYLLHVEEDIFHMKRIHEVHPPLESEYEEFHEKFISGKKKLLEKFKRYVPEKVFADAIIKEGHPFVEIIKYAQKQYLDVIVMSSRGKSNIKHAFLGSTTDKVSRKATCAVLIVKDKKCKFVSL